MDIGVDWDAKPQMNQLINQSIKNTKYFTREYCMSTTMADSELLSVSHVVNSDPKQILTLASSDLHPIRTLTNSDPI